MALGAPTSRLRAGSARVSLPAGGDPPDELGGGEHLDPSGELPGEVTDVPGHEGTGSRDGAFEERGIIGIGKPQDYFQGPDLDTAGAFPQTGHEDVDFNHGEPEFRPLQDLVVLGQAALVDDRADARSLDPVDDPPRRPMGR